MELRRSSLMLAAIGLFSLCACKALAGSPPGAFALNLPMSVRQAGMGEISTGVNDVLNVWTNPASISDMKAQGEAALTGGPMYGGVQNTFGLAGGYKLSDEWTLAAMLHSWSVEFESVDAFGDPGEDIYHGVVSFGLAGAYSWRWLRAGVTVKQVQEDFDDDKASVGAGDLGLTAFWRDFTFSFAVRNMGGEMRKGTGTNPEWGESLPTEVRLGGAYLHRPWNLKGALEISTQSERDGRIAMGLDWWPSPKFALRGGIYGPFDDSEGGGPSATFGLSGIYERICLDYAIRTHNLGATNTVALSYSFGPAAEEERPVKAVEKKREPAPAAPVERGKKLNVAVGDLRAENVSPGDAAVIADILRSELVKTGAFNVIEKQNMDKVLAEHAFQQTGCTSEECAVKLGKLLNVQRMGVGSFGKLLDSYFLNIRVINVETGEVTYADSVEGRTVSDLKIGVRNLAEKLAKELR